MDTLRSSAARAGRCACAVNEAVQTRISKIFFPFNDKEIPPKLRKQAWAFRVTYICWTGGQTILLFYCPHTYLWTSGSSSWVEESELNAHAAWTVLLMLLATWFFYFQFQGSNPGYITAEMLHRFNTKHDVFGVGPNGEGDSFSMAVFRKITNLGRRTVTAVQHQEEDDGDDDEEGGQQQRQQQQWAGGDAAPEYKDDGDDDDDESSSSGEEGGDRKRHQPAPATATAMAVGEVAIAVGSGGGGGDDGDSDGSGGEPAFVAADAYQGPKTGYYFAAGQQGSGYYRDAAADGEDSEDGGAGSQRQGGEGVSAKARQAESMARVERFLAGQDRGRARKYWVPKFDPRKYDGASQHGTVGAGAGRRGARGGGGGDSDGDGDGDGSDGGGDSSGDSSGSAAGAGGGKYADKRFTAENGEISRGDAEEGGSFQTKMDFQDIADDFPLRSRYCKQADRVVPKFDHYCTTLGTPVGERNHALFWMFLVAQSILLVWGISIAASGFTGNPVFGPQRWVGRNALVIVNTVLLSVEALGVAGLLVFQTWGACTDTLTYEFLKNNDLEYLADFGPCDLPFSKGQCRNFYRFFVVQPGWCRATKDWLPTKYAPPEQFYRDSSNVCMNPWENKYYRCC